MDIQQMYNQSAMLRDAFVAKANEVNDEGERQKFNQLASDQQSIYDRLNANLQQQNQQHVQQQQAQQQNQQQAQQQQGQQQAQGQMQQNQQNPNQNPHQ
jgi:SWI/SNF chromatin-remodeling complex subunit SWI1